MRKFISNGIYQYGEQQAIEQGKINSKLFQKYFENVLTS